MAKQNTPPNDENKDDNNNDPIFIPFEEEENDNDDFAEEQRLRKAFKEHQRTQQNKKQEPTYEPTEDEEEFDRDPLFETAMRLLPIDSPAVLTAIQKVSNINLISLMTGGLAERVFRGENGIDDLTLDYIITASLIAGADNLNEISHLFEEEVLYYTRDLLQINAFDNEGDIDSDRYYTNAPKTVRRIYTTQTVAQLAAIKSELENKNQLVCTHENLEELADFLIRESNTKPYENVEADEHLLNIGVDTFNEIAETIEFSTLLRISQNGEITKHENLGPTNFYHPPKNPKP